MRTRKKIKEMMKNEIEIRKVNQCLIDLVRNTPKYDKMCDDRGEYNERIGIMSPSGEQVGYIDYLQEFGETIVRENSKFTFKNHTIYYDNDSKSYFIYRNRIFIEMQNCPVISLDLPHLDKKFFDYLCVLNSNRHRLRQILNNHEYQLQPIERRYFIFLRGKL